MQVNVPEQAPISHFFGPAYGPNGVAVRQADDGRLVIDILPKDFFSLLNGRDGAHWAKANPDVGAELSSYRFM